MDKQINLDDNIFLLNVRIRMLTDLLSLDVDPGLYLEKSLDDLKFIDHVLDSLFKYLTENSIFPDREDELNKLTDLEFRFEQLLTGMGRCFPSAKEQLLNFKNLCAARRQNIDTSRSSTEQSSSEPVVSSMELNELLREFQD